MTRLTLAAFALAVASCRGKPVAVRLSDEPSAPRVGALVVVDAFGFRICDLDAIAFPSSEHGYVRDTCGSVYGTLDGGQSFVAVDPLNRGWKGYAPYPLVGEERALEWRRFPHSVSVDGAVVAIDAAQRHIVVDHTRLLPIRTKGTTRERILGMAPSKFGVIAWTAHTVLSSDGRGPLVARGRIEGDEIESVVRPFEYEWLARTKHGAILRTRKQGWINEGDDPHALVAADDFDRWVLERAERTEAVSPIERGLAEGGTLTVAIARRHCSDTHRSVTYSLRRRRGVLLLSIDDGLARTLSSGEAEVLQPRLLHAWSETAIANQWYSSQPLTITVAVEGQRVLRGRYTFSSPLVSEVLSAFGE